MKLDPDLIFVTGWNEWTAGRLFDWDVKPFAFVDEYIAEKSRDIEPVKSWGNKGDVYYMQLISNVRRFKGMQNQDTVSGAKTSVKSQLCLRGALIFLLFILPGKLLKPLKSL